MGIGRISGLYQYQPMEPIKRVDVATVKAQDEVKRQQENAIVNLPQAQDTQIVPDTRSKMADLENISLSFNAGDTYDYIGKDSDLNLLDMDQLISDMKKDSVLDQYRYFVGAEEASEFAGGLNGDGIVIIK